MKIFSWTNTFTPFSFLTDIDEKSLFLNFTFTISENFAFIIYTVINLFSW